MVHCHIGSLENDNVSPNQIRAVHCHIGSLEKVQKTVYRNFDRSLPYRQLRKLPTALP